MSEETSTTFLDSDIYKNWDRYHDQYKHALSQEDIQDIKRQIESINHEIESAPSFKGRYGPLFIIEKLYAIQKRIAKGNGTIRFDW
jgi:hypothetical protein